MVKKTRTCTIVSFVYFILECVNVCEFCWGNYVLNESEKESVTQENVNKLLDYKFKQAKKLIYEGADMYTTLEYGAWKQRCQALLQTFFCSDGKGSGIITFPNAKDETEGKPWKSIMKTLIDWCKHSNSDNYENNPGHATGLIIRNYNLKNHLNFCGISDDEIKAALTFRSFEENFRTLENIERFLVFNPSMKNILIIRMVTPKDPRQLKDEVYYCIDEVILLSFLLKDELKDSGVILTGLVVYSGENIHIQNGCTDCDNFIVSSKVFESSRNFDNFWEKLVNEKKFKVFSSDLVALEKSNKANWFEAVASKIIGYLAHLQLNSTEKPVLLLPEKEPAGNIKQAELLLDKCQMEIAYSDEKRVLLFGNYGTGKTVVALKKLELLYLDLKEKDVIYYVNFAGKSQLHLEIMEKNKTREKVKVIGGGTSLSKIVISKILPEEEKNETKNINLIVDEYDSQYLSEKESETLYQIFEKEQFKHSTVLIAVQPIKIDRIDYFTYVGGERPYSEEKHMFGKLEGIMSVFELRSVKRTTVEINDLIRFTQIYLNFSRNQYEGELKSYNEDRNTNVSGNKFPKFRQESSETSSNTENMPKQLLHYSSNKSKSSSNIISGFSWGSSIDTMSIHSQEIIDLDELYKLMSTPSKKNKTNLQKRVTKYFYPCHSEIGHGIKGPLPKLIKLPKLSDSRTQIVLTAFLLIEIIKIKSKRIAIIHFDKTDPLWFQLLFKFTNFFPGLTVTSNVGEFLRNSDNTVLVNNYNCLKGLEFSEVLLILDTDEYHLKQYIPEAIARCKSNLAILVRPKPQEKSKSETVADLVHHWEESNNREILKTGRSILKILKLKVSYNFKKHENCKGYCQKGYCQKDKSEYTSYKLHRRSKLYKNLSAKIKPSIVQNLYLEAKNTTKEVEAM